MFKNLGDYWDAKKELKESHPELYKLLDELIENGTERELNTVFSWVNTELWTRD